jgi:hypothetical protein
MLFGENDSSSKKGDTWEFADPTFDGDCDGDLDLRDIATFQRCFSPSVPPDAECVRFDPSGEEGVDLADFAALRAELTGPIPTP